MTEKESKDDVKDGAAPGEDETARSDEVDSEQSAAAKSDAPAKSEPPAAEATKSDAPSKSDAPAKSEPPAAEATKSDAPAKSEPPAAAPEPPKVEAKKSSAAKAGKKAEAKTKKAKKAAAASDGASAGDSADRAAKAKHDHHAHLAHDHAPDRKEYWRIWGWLLALTILEVGIAYLEKQIGKTALVTALVGLALAKAACVAFFFMHLKHESKVMRWTVAFPMLFPALYAFILIAEGVYRALWGAS